MKKFLAIPLLMGLVFAQDAPNGQSAEIEPTVDMGEIDEEPNKPEEDLEEEDAAQPDELAESDEAPQRTDEEDSGFDEEDNGDDNMMIDDEQDYNFGSDGEMQGEFDEEEELSLDENDEEDPDIVDLVVDPGDRPAAGQRMANAVKEAHFNHQKSITKNIPGGGQVTIVMIGDSDDEEDEESQEELQNVMEIMSQMQGQMIMQQGGMGMFGPGMGNMNPFNKGISEEEKKKVEGYQLTKKEKDQRFKDIQERTQRDKKPPTYITAQQVQIYAFFTFVFGAIIYLLVQSIRLKDEDAQLELVKENNSRPLQASKNAVTQEKHND